MSNPDYSVTLPSLRAIIGGFHLNSSSSVFNCSTFDQLADQLHLSSSQYSCGAYPPGDSGDVAIHYHSPSKGISLSKPAKALVVIISTVAGLLLFALLLQLCRRRSRRSDTGESVDMRSLGSRRSQRSTNSQGVVRQASQDDGLPAYRRDPKPGEVPPGYGETQAQDQGASSAGAENCGPESSNINTSQEQTPNLRTGLLSAFTALFQRRQRAPNHTAVNT